MIVDMGFQHEATYIYAQIHCNTYALQHVCLGNLCHISENEKKLNRVVLNACLTPCK